MNAVRSLAHAIAASRTSGLATIQHSDRADAKLRNATVSGASPRVAGDCFSPAMHKRGRLVPAATAALLLLYGIARSLSPGAIVRARPSA